MSHNTITLYLLILLVIYILQVQYMVYTRYLLRQYVLSEADVYRRQLILCSAWATVM